jgi:transposase, IS30 family
MQGSEMGCHHELIEATGVPVYFCDPASPWQRGSNENMNGLLRRYFQRAPT